MGTVGTFKVVPNYLGIELRNRLQRGPIKFTFSVQLEKDPQATPTEDGLVEWKESDTPSVPVAELARLSLFREESIDLSRCRVRK